MSIYSSLGSFRKVIGKIVLLFLVYTPVRAWWNSLLQYIYDRKVVPVKLPTFSTLQELSGYLMGKFRYVSDPQNGLMDYHSEPEIFISRLLDPRVKDGDCDDIAWAFSKMAKRVPGVATVTILNIRYESGAHAVTLVEKWNNKTICYDLYLFNYGLSFVLDAKDAATKVAYSSDKTYGTLKWYLEEDLKMKPIKLFIA